LDSNLKALRTHMEEKARTKTDSKQ